MTHQVGDRVLAFYSDGLAYPATIAAVNAGNCYVVDWDDGDERCRERDGTQIIQPASSGAKMPRRAAAVAGEEKRQACWVANSSRRTKKPHAEPVPTTDGEQEEQRPRAPAALAPVPAGELLATRYENDATKKQSIEFLTADGILEKIVQLQREVCEATAAKVKAEEVTTAKVKAVKEVTATATELRARCGEYESQNQTMQAEIATLKQQLNEATAIAHCTVEQDTAAKQDLSSSIAPIRPDYRGEKALVQKLEKELSVLNCKYRKAMEREESLAAFLFDDNTPCRIWLCSATRKPSAAERGLPGGGQFLWNERHMHWVHHSVQGQQYLFQPLPLDVTRFAEARAKAKAKAVVARR